MWGFLAIAALAADWTQWGGPRRDFTAPALADSWQEAGPRKLWARELGPGHAAVIVWEGLAFAMSGDGSIERVVAFDAESGEERWSHSYEVRYRASGAYGGPHSTPLVDAEGRLVTVSIDAKVHAFDAREGRLLWSHDLLLQDGVDLPQSGFAASPLAWGESVIVAATGGSGPSVIALRRDDGRTVWARHSFLGSHASPIVIEHGGRAHLVVHATNFLVGLDPGTGDLLWRGRVRRDAVDNVSFTPIWDAERGRLFVSHAYDGSGLQAWQLAGDSGSGWSVERVWSNRRLKVEHGNGVLVDGAVYASDGGSAAFLVGVDAETGETLFKQRGVPKATLVAVGDKLLVLDEEGALRLAEPGQGRIDELGRAEVLGSQAWTVPTLVGRRVFVRDSRRLVALELP